MPGAVRCKLKSLLCRSKPAQPSSAIPCVEAPAYLAYYGYAVTGLQEWDAFFEPPELRIRVSGHKESRRHTHYCIDCLLVEPTQRRQIEWHVEKRLRHLRKYIHDPLKRELGINYKELFKGACFAHHCGLAGTTAKLDRWCRRLAQTINSELASPSTVASVLRFLNSPVCEPPVLLGRPQYRLEQVPSASSHYAAQSLRDDDVDTACTGADLVAQEVHGLLRPTPCRSVSCAPTSSSATLSRSEEDEHFSMHPELGLTQQPRHMECVVDATSRAARQFDRDQELYAHGLSSSSASDCSALEDGLPAETDGPLAYCCADRLDVEEQLSGTTSLWGTGATELSPHRVFVPACQADKEKSVLETDVDSSSDDECSTAESSESCETDAIANGNGYRSISSEEAAADAQSSGSQHVADANAQAASARFVTQVGYTADPMNESVHVAVPLRRVHFQSENSSPKPEGKLMAMMRARRDLVEPQKISSRGKIF